MESLLRAPPSNLYHSIMRSPSQITPVTRRIFGTLFLLNFTLLSAAMAGKTGLKAKWRHLANLPRSGERHPHHRTPLPYAPSNFQLGREGARGCTFGGNTLTPAMALRSAAKLEKRLERNPMELKPLEENQRTF